MLPGCMLLIAEVLLIPLSPYNDLHQMLNMLCKQGSILSEEDLAQ